MRRLVSRTMAQQLSKVVERCTAPYQYAMSTKAGIECIAHALQMLTELDPQATVVSIDGVGAYDTISRKAMLEALARMPGGAEALPFVRLFYGQPSQYLWEDAEGTVHTVAQGEGGEQGDPLMPLLFSLGQHAALEAAHSRMRTGKTLFAFLDDVYFGSSLTGSETCTRLWSKSCTDILGSESTRARLKCGTQQELDRKRVTRLRELPGHLTPTHECGKGQDFLLRNKECVSWAPLWGTQILCRLT